MRFDGALCHYFRNVDADAVSAAASADTIHLKNGRTILADHVRENGSRYEYEIGDDTYAIPKSSVERVEAGGMPASAASSGAARVRRAPRFHRRLIASRTRATCLRQL